MNITATTAPPESLSVDLLAVAVGDDLAQVDALDALLGGHLRPVLEQREFTGKPGTSVRLPTLGGLAARELVLLGVGDGAPAAIHRAAALAGREARAARATSLALDLACDHTAALVEALHAGAYLYEAYKPEDERTPALSEVLLRGDHGDAELARGAVRARWQGQARDWVNAPPAELFPESLAAEARRLADLPGVTVEVWDWDRCLAEGCVGIRAVGAGSSKPGALIHVAYRPEAPAAHVALVGKGVTFDAGGLSLKPTAGMVTMKCDMGGAATVLAATGAVAELGLPVAVDTFVGAVENLLGADAYKLGDVLRYPNGVTVEIHNTDAEGRLVLADALLQASKVEGATHIVDAATLTGAAVVALGPEFTALFTADDRLACDLMEVATGEGEGLWRLPLHQPYKRMLKSEVAKIKNVGGREAGSTTAALFLSHFVGEGKKWVHLDIAGPAFADKPHGPWVYGGTGQMVRTLASWIGSLADA